MTDNYTCPNCGKPVPDDNLSMFCDSTCRTIWADCMFFSIKNLRYVAHSDGVK